jgi:S-(hydroxymethyl)glutathione dehydrogenase/alcohol dehydrogenase
MPHAAVMNAYDAPLAIESLDLRDPRPNEVVVRLAASGVCHSDLSVLRGKLPVPPPAVLGHEGAGVVEAVGDAVRSLAEGDHVVLSWIDRCGTCVYCESGRPHLCDKTMVDAASGRDDAFRRGETVVGRMAGIGTFAERTIAPASAVVKIPADVPLDRACLVGCGVMTGVGAAINTADIQPGEHVAVFGCGGVGLNVIQGAALAGAGRIVAVDREPRKLVLAKRFGATDVVEADGRTDVPGAVREIAGGLGADHAFEVIGVPDVILQAYHATRRGGTVVVVGVTALDQTVPIPAAMLVMEEKRVIGSLYGSANPQRDMPMLIDLYTRGRLNLDELVTRRITLDEVNAAFDAMEAGDVARSVIVY